MQSLQVLIVALIPRSNSGLDIHLGLCVRRIRLKVSGAHSVVRYAYHRVPRISHGSQATPLKPIRLEVPSRPRRVLTALGVVVTPISAIVAISLLIALVDPLKALFVSFEGGPSWKGPDGKPPLAFVIDTGSSTPLFILAEFPDTVHCPRKAQLIGAMSVPMTLFLLGVSFARMDVKLNPKSGLPISALLSVCILKLVIMPVIGFFVTRALITGGLINPESKVQIFVAIIVSCTPSALR